MTVAEKLNEEFGCAISAVLGDLEEQEWENYKENFTKEDLLIIAKKVAFYLDL